jgi:ferredoxin
VYRRALSWLLRQTLRLDVYINKVYPTDWNPLYYTGGLTNLFLLVLVVSGILLLFYYVASLDGAYASVAYLTERVPYGGLLRGIHRYAADAFIIAALLHLFRNWFTDRYLFSRDGPWISGMFLLILGGFVGVNGYQMVWDQRAQAVTQIFVDLLSAIPLLGGPLARLFLGGRGISDTLLPRVLFLHVGVASFLYLLLWWHYVRLRHPKIWPPATWVLTTLGLIILLAALPGTAPVAGVAAEPGVTVTSYPLDVFFLLPFWLTNWLPPVVVTLGLILLFGAGYVIPYLARETEPQMGVRHAGVAQVIDGNCTGCELCYYDCPYDAIVMVPSPHPGITKAAANRKLFAVVMDSRCVECGICIGACPFEALELPKFLEADLTRAISQAVGAPAPAVASAVTG